MASYSSTAYSTDAYSVDAYDFDDVPDVWEPPVHATLTLVQANVTGTLTITNPVYGTLAINHPVNASLSLEPN